MLSGYNTYGETILSTRIGCNVNVANILLNAVWKKGIDCTEDLRYNEKC